MPRLSLDPSTRSWIIQTLTGYIFLALWVLSILTPPVVTLSGSLGTVVFGIAVAALGLQVTQSAKAVQSVSRAQKSQAS